MASYEIRLKEAALENLRASRERVLEHLGTAQIGERLAAMDARQAGEMANDLLSLLDEVDRVLSRAKKVG